MDTIMIVMLIIGVVGLTITELNAYKKEKKYREKEDKNGNYKM